MIPLARDLDAEYILVFFGDYFEKLGSNIVSRNNMVAPKITQIAAPAVFNGLKPIASLERNKEPYDLYLYGVSHIWSNRQYGLYRLIG